MPFKMRQDNHEIIIDDMAAHSDFFQMLAAADRQIHIAFFIHNIYKAKRPAIDLQRFSMTGRRVAIALIQRIRFYNRTVRDMLYKCLNHVTGQNIRPMLFSCMQLNSYFAVNPLIRSYKEIKCAASMCFVKYTLACEPASLLLCGSSALPTTGAWAKEFTKPPICKTATPATTPAGDLKKNPF